VNDQCHLKEICCGVGGNVPGRAAPRQTRRL
jgi:hypothetical protein